MLAHPQSVRTASISSATQVIAHRFTACSSAKLRDLSPGPHPPTTVAFRPAMAMRRPEVERATAPPMIFGSVQSGLGCPVLTSRQRSSQRLEPSATRNACGCPNATART